MGIMQTIGPHPYSDVNAESIVQRILKSRDIYEERQRKKGVKAEMEAAAKQREALEEEQQRILAARASGA